MIKVNFIHKTFGSEGVLYDLSLTLNRGELAALIGTSGAGKTVLARCLVGLESIDSGFIEIDEISFGAGIYSEDKRWIQARKKIALLSQNRALPPYRNVLDQIMEGPRFVLGMDKAKSIEVSLPWIARFGLEQHLEKYPQELSGGQLARVCLARAVVMSPTYLICDELSANLDPFMAAEVAKSLLEVAQTGMGILFISHQIEFIRRYASVVHLLENGSIVCSGNPQILLSNPSNESLRRYLNVTELAR